MKNFSIQVFLKNEAALPIVPERRRVSFVQARSLTLDMSEFSFRAPQAANFLPDGPYGNSYPRAGNDRDVDSVAGGYGLSPVLSIPHGAIRSPELGGELAAVDRYFCGPPPMTDTVQRMLQLDHEVTTKQLYFDRFI